MGCAYFTCVLTPDVLLISIIYLVDNLNIPLIYSDLINFDFQFTLDYLTIKNAVNDESCGSSAYSLCITLVYAS